MLRDTVQKVIFIIEFRRIACQSLGLGSWRDNLTEYGDAIRTALQKMGVSKLKRIGFQATAFLPLGMSHSEMVDLMFGSYLAPLNDLRTICGKPEDAFLMVHGEHADMKLQLSLAPMTAEQASQQVMSTNNLEHFLEPKLLDTAAKDFRDRVATECLYIGVDLSRSDVTNVDVQTFLRHALDGVDTVSLAAVQHLKSLRSARK